MFKHEYLFFCYLFLAASWVAALIMRRRPPKNQTGARRLLEDDE